MSPLAPVLMVQGTSSSAGKSTLVTGLCRLFARSGVRVAPFKAQNMSNNAAVCPDGGEIGRAQHTQALAAGLQPDVHMNPILLKPQDGSSQLIVRGEVRGRRTTADYLAGPAAELQQVVRESLDHLRASYDLVICEGAGSPAEINLRAQDLSNMAVALHAGADVLLVSDIDRGGAFAALLGTWQWLSPEERARVRGFVLNKFRGNAALLAPAPDLLEARTGVPVVGTIPFVKDLDLPEEDAASFSPGPALSSPTVEIAILRLPHLANFDEFSELSREPGVQMRWVTRPQELRAPDLVILPGSKATVPDLLWVHERQLAARLVWLAEHGTPLLGLCGGYQMLGQEVSDPRGVESDQHWAQGLGLLPATTELGEEKRLTEAEGQVLGGPGLWASLAGYGVEGYEMHVGRTRATEGSAFIRLGTTEEGAVAPHLPVAGTYVHGLLRGEALRRALLRALAQHRGLEWQPPSSREAAPAWDRLADELARHLRLPPARFPSITRFATMTLQAGET